MPISEAISATSNWSLGAVSVNPSTADIGVTTSVSAVPLGQNSTYNITVNNNGPSAANNVVSDRHLRSDRIGDRIGDAQRRNDLCDWRNDHLHASGSFCQRRHRDGRRGGVDYDRGFLSEYRDGHRLGHAARSKYRKQYLCCAGPGGERGLLHDHSDRRRNAERRGEHLLSRNCECGQGCHIDSGGHSDRRGRHDRERQSAAGDPDAGCHHQHDEQCRVRKREHGHRLYRDQ